MIQIPYEKEAIAKELGDYDNWQKLAREDGFNTALIKGDILQLHEPTIYDKSNEGITKTINILFNAKLIKYDKIKIIYLDTGGEVEFVKDEEGRNFIIKEEE